MKKQSGLKSKLIKGFLFMGLAPLIIAIAVTYWKTTHLLDSSSSLQAEAIGKDKVHSIQSYFQATGESLTDLAENPSTLAAFEGFEEGFDRIDGGNSNITEMTPKIRAYWVNDFQKMHVSKNPKNPAAIEELFSKLDSKSIAAQFDFVAENSNPLGEKIKLDSPVRETTYAKVHRQYHPWLRTFLNRHALYDIFFVTPEGRVIYTCFKELDFSTDLKKGPWAQSGLANAFEKSKALKSGEIYLEDFARYTPSYEAPASFMATPIFKANKFVGSLIVQVPLDKITASLATREGMGTKGESYVVGSDFKLRSDTFRNKETYNVALSFEPNSQVQIKTPAIEKALAGETGILNLKTYDQMDVLSSYAPLKIFNLNWALVTELSAQEIRAGARVLNALLFLILVISGIAIFGAAWLTGGSIAGRISLIIEDLYNSALKVSSFSDLSAKSSTELSQAATQQAASLQETMASAEEISAMVAQNAEHSATAKSVVDGNQESTHIGEQNVSEMVIAINDIRQTNDEILRQMEESNKEFSAIVKIISEIGDKTKVINDIVFQTKLLSFNASVEAARAGEHGKGFAVVAEEVGNLARMSGNAAKEISDMLSHSIGKVNSIVEDTTKKVDRLVEVGKDKISTGAATAQNCKEALGKISQNANAISGLVSEIASASKEQAQGVQEINKAIAQLDQVTQQNTSMAGESSSLAGSLMEESRSLTKTIESLVDYFGTSKNETSAPEKQHSYAKKTSNLVSDRVVSLSDFRKKSEPSPAEVTEVKTERKKAVNESAVPNGDDPNFEEF